MFFRKKWWIGQMTLFMEGNPASQKAVAGSSITVVEPPPIPGTNKYTVALFAWPLFFESQIVKLPRGMQNIITDAIEGMVYLYYNTDKAVIPPLEEHQPDHVSFGVMRVRLYKDKYLFTETESFWDIDKEIDAKTLTGLMLINSFNSVFHELDEEKQDSFMILLDYGLRKWKKRGRPCQWTWDFNNLDGILKELAYWRAKD